MGSNRIRIMDHIHIFGYSAMRLNLTEYMDAHIRDYILFGFNFSVKFRLFIKWIWNIYRSDINGDTDSPNHLHGYMKGSSKLFISSVQQVITGLCFLHHMLVHRLGLKFINRLSWNSKHDYKDREARKNMWIVKTSAKFEIPLD